jgi:glycosyltransferase involved in cell wall biosynthesis
MVILMIAGRGPSLINFRGHLLGEMVRRGHEVHAAAPGLTSDEKTCSALERLGVTPHDTVMDRAGFDIRNDIRFARAVKSLCQEIGADLIIGYTIKPVIWGTIGASLAKVPNRVALITGLGYVFTGSLSSKRALLRKAVSLLYRFALARATLVFFQNRDDREEFATHGILASEDAAHVVDGSGVDVGHYKQAELPEGPITFLMISRLIASKGVRDFAEAARRVRKLHPDVQFCLIGRFDDNPETLPREEVMKWEQDGVLKRIDEIPDVRPALAASHVFVLPSAYREGVPRVVLEALSTGRAVITTDAPGCRETVRSGEGANGFLVSTYDPDALASAMLRYINEPELIAAHGKAGRALAEERFDVPIISQKMLSLMKL